MTPQDIKALIQAGLPDAQIEIIGDDGVHFEARVISPLFRGLSVVKQHQLVYKTLGARMGKEIHALALKTDVPEAA